MTNKERITANNEKIDELIALIRQKKLDSFVLPELTNPAIENEVFQGKEFIKENGEVGVGTYVQPDVAEDLDAELDEQDELLTDIEAKINEMAKLELAGTPNLVYTLSSDGTYYIVGTGFTSIEAIASDTGGGTEGSGLDGTWQGGRVVIPSTYNDKPVLAIAPRAFAGFYNITQVYICDGITHIGHRCFNCPNSPWDTAMTSCRLPNTLVYIGGEDGRVFFGRQGLTSMAIPAGISDLTRAVFAYCNALTAVYTYNVKKLVRSCFQDCNALKTLNTDNMEVVGDVSFYNCSSLTELNLPKVETIGNNVFYNATSLTKVTIGPNCKSVDTSGLKCGSSSNKCTFTFLGTTPPTITTSTFATSNINKIIVPKGCGNAYKNATNWTLVASLIEEAA